MRFNKEKRIMIMNLVDLEHCGFDWDEYCSELRMHGIADEEARNPIAIIVNFAGGAIITPDTQGDTLAAMVAATLAATQQFEKLVAIIERGDGE